MTHVSIQVLVCCCLFAFCVAQSVPFNPNTDNIQQAFDSILGTEDKLAQLGITSIVISAVHNNKMIFSRGYGNVNPNEQAQKVAPDPQRSQYSIGSISKTFTALCLLQQVEAQKFALNSSVNSGLPDTPGIIKNEIIGDSLGDSSSGKPRTETVQEVTMANLLTHTSGFDETVIGISARSFSSKQPLKQYMEQHMPPRIRKPNIVSTYSNHAVSLAGLVVEQVAKVPFGTYLKDHVLTPLNLTHTIYEYPEQGLLHDPYFPRPSVRTNIQTYVELSNYGQYIQPAPAGAMWSTAEDMAKYMIVHLNYGVDPSSSHRVLSQQMAQQMYKQQFTMAPGLPGYGYIWWQLYSDNMHYIEHGGTLSPYHSQLSLFHDSNSGLFMALVGTNAAALQILKNKFIAVTMKNESTYCNAPDQQYYASSGTCTQTVPVSSILPVSKDYKDRFAKYQGCYKNFRYEHTTWFKIATLFTEPICVTRFTDDLPALSLVSSQTTNMIMWELDRNLFRIGVLTADGTNVTYSITKNSTASFVLDELLDRAGYLAIDQFPFEYADSNIIWGSLFVVSFGLLCAMCCCCCCGCILTWGVLDFSTYLSIYRNRAQNKEDKIFNHEFNQITPEFSEEDEEEGVRLAGSGYRSTQIKYEKQKRISKLFLALAITLTLVTVFGILWITALNIAHFQFTFTQIMIIQSTDNFLFEQKSRTGLSLTLTLPVLSAIGAALLIVSCLGAIVFRLLKRQQLGWSYTIMLGGAVVVCVTMNIFYMVTTGYFNIFGATLLN